MRFRPALLCFAAALAASPCTFSQSSFGPEISAEDFNLRLQRVTTTTSSGAQRLLDLRDQLAHLNLLTRMSTCDGQHGLLAEMVGTESARGPVLYYAWLADAAQIAGVLEIAERFMTTKPRPKHAVLFAFGTDAQPRTDCLAGPMARVIQPANLPTDNAAALVQQLIALHRQGL